MTARTFSASRPLKLSAVQLAELEYSLSGAKRRDDILQEAQRRLSTALADPAKSKGDEIVLASLNLISLVNKAEERGFPLEALLEQVGAGLTALCEANHRQLDVVTVRGYRRYLTKV